MSKPHLWQIHWTGHVVNQVAEKMEDFIVEVEPTTIRRGAEGVSEALGPVEIYVHKMAALGTRSQQQASLVVHADLKASAGEKGKIRIELNGSRAGIHSPVMLPDMVPLRTGELVEVGCQALPIEMSLVEGIKDKKPVGEASADRLSWQLALTLPNELVSSRAICTFDESCDAKAKEASAALNLHLSAEITPLRLVEDVGVPSCLGLNTLGNFQAQFTDGRGLIDGWHVSDDGSVIHAPAELVMALAAEADVQIHRGSECIFDSTAASSSGSSVRVPLEKLPHGQHKLSIKLTPKGSDEALTPEVLRLSVKSDTPTFANLPIARRFVKGVDVADGHLTHTSTDLSLPAAGLPLEFIRTYSNLGATAADAHPLGVGWTHNYYSWLQPYTQPQPLGQPQPPRQFLIVGGEGSGRIYQLGTGATTAIGTAGYHGTLIEKDGGYELTTPAGVMYRYSVKTSSNPNRFYLEQVRDLNQNTVRLSYNSAGLLDRVTDASGTRHLRFTYTDKPVGAQRYKLLTSIDVFNSDTPLGIHLDYGYDALGNLATAERKAAPKNRAQVYTYSSNDPLSTHRLLSYTNPEGKATSYTYKQIPPNAANDPVARLELERVVLVQEPGGRSTRFEYVHQNQVPISTKITLPGQPPTVYYFDPQYSNGTVKKIEEPGGRTTVFDWRNTDRLLAHENDSAGRTIDYDYMGPGNLFMEKLSFKNLRPEFEQVHDSSGHVVDGIQTEYAYTSLGRVERVTRTDFSAGQPTVKHETVYRYDRGNLIHKIEPEGRETSCKFDSHGNLLERSRTDGEFVTYSNYNAFGQPQIIKERINPSGKEQITYQTFDLRGRLISSRDEVDGVAIRKVETDYDDLDFPRQERKSGPTIQGLSADSVRVTNFVFSPGGLLEAENHTEGLNGRTVFARKWSYDPLGRILQVEELPRGIEAEKLYKRFQYDDLDRINLETNRIGVSLRRSYDPLGRLEIVTREWNEGGQLKVVREASYSHWGMTDKVRTVIDPQGNTTETHYDALFRVVRRKLASGYEEKFQYDTQGNLLSKTDGNGSTTRYNYDKLGQKIEETDPLGNVKTFKYDRDGKLISKSDMTAGLTTTYKYDVLRRMVDQTEIFPQGNTTIADQTTYEFDDAYHRVRITKPKPTVIKIDEYRDDRGLVVLQVSDLDGIAARSTFKYDSLGNLVEEKDAAGSTTTYEVDGLGRRRSITYELGVKETYDYDGEGNVWNHTDRAGNQNIRRYDSRNRLVGEWVQGHGESGTTWLRTIKYDDVRKQSMETVNGGSTTTTTYDELGRPASIVHDQYPDRPLIRRYTGVDLTGKTDRRGNWTTYEYDALHRLTAYHDAEGRTVRTDYQDQQRKRTITDGKGIKTEILTDPKGRQIELRRAGKRQWTRTYDGEDRILSSTDAMGYTTTNVYDGAARLVKVRMPAGRTLRYAYDAAGNRTNQWLVDDPSRVPDRTVVYDKLHRVSSEKDASGFVTAYEYDGEGRKIAETDPEGLRTVFEYDRLGQIKSITRDPGQTNSRYEFERDAAGRLIAAKDPTGRTIKFDYDHLGRIIKRTLVPISVPGSVSEPPLETIYEYDVDGNLVKVTRPDGSIRAVSFDKVSRVATVGHSNPHGAYDPYAESVTLGYDKNDNLVVAESHKVFLGSRYTETYSLGYDDFNRVAWETTAFGPPADSHTAAPVRSFWRSYDDNGRLIKFTDPDSKETVYSYNDRGMLTGIQAQAGAVSYEYFTDDRLKKVTLPKTYRTEVERLPNGRVNKIRHFSPDGKPIVEYLYELNKMGDVARMEVRSSVQTDARTYGYDRLHRLSQEDFEGGAIQKYEYDLAGRRAKILINGAPHQTWQCDGYGRLKQVLNDQQQPWMQLVYTQTGLVRERWASGILARFWYNPLQQLAVAQVGPATGPGAPIVVPPGQSSEVMRIDYDYRGRRLKRLGPSDSVVFVHAELECIAELDWPVAPQSKIIRRYERGPVFLAVLKQNPGDQRKWLVLQDRVRSAVRIVDLSSATHVSKDYSAFGNVVKQDGAIDDVPFGFAGGRNEPLGIGLGGNHLVQMGERIYDTAAGRFMAPDPAEPIDPSGLSEDGYVYAHNRPTSYLDPTGLQAESVDEDDDEEEDTTSWHDFAQKYLLDGEGPDEELEHELQDLEEQDAAESGKASSARDDEGLAPLRPRNTTQSLQPEVRSAAASPLSGGPVALEGEAEVRESRGANENGFVSGLASLAARTVLSWGDTAAETLIRKIPTEGGLLIEKLAGGNLPANTPYIDTLASEMIEQIKATTAEGIRGELHKKALPKLEKAVTNWSKVKRYIMNNAPELESLVESAEVGEDTRRVVRVIVPTGEKQEALEKGLQAMEDWAHEPGMRKAELVVEEGIPGKWGKAARGLGYLGAAWSASELPGDIRRGEYFKASVDTANVVAVASRAAAGQFAAVYVAGTLSYSVGHAAGTAINARLSPSTREVIGDALYSTVMEGGWREIYRHPFGWGMN